MDLMEFSMTEGNDTLTGDENFLPPQLMQTPSVANSILKPSTKGNLMQFNTPKAQQKNVKVKFETPQSVKMVSQTRYEPIADVDEKENWIQRTSIVSKTDHLMNLEFARDIINSIINDLPVWKSKPITEVDKPGNESEEEETFYDADEATSDTNEVTNKALSDTQGCPATPTPAPTDMFSAPQETAVSTPTPTPTDVFSASQEIAVLNKQPVSDVLPVSVPPSSTGILDVSMECVETDVMATEEPMDCDETAMEVDVTVISSKTLIEDRAASPKEPQETPVTVVTSPPLPVSKGAYSIDFDNLDNFNPFQTMGGINTSPKINSETNKKSAVGEKDEAEQVLLNTDTVESVPDSQAPANILNIEAEVLPDVNHNTDFLVDDKAKPFVTLSDPPSGISIDISLDAFTTKPQVSNSPLPSGISTENPLFDPFTTNSKVASSPQLSTISVDDTSSGTFTMKSKVSDSPPPAGISTENALSDPLTVRNNMANSPPISGISTENSLSDPFTMKSKVANSPPPSGIPTEHLSDPFTTKQKVANSPLPSGISTAGAFSEPFTTKSKVASSPQPPGISTEKCFSDPFTTKSKMANSPPPSGIPTEDCLLDPLTENAPPPVGISAEDALTDPFTTKSKMANSPPPSRTSTEDTSSDPFTTKSNMANSPPPSGISTGDTSSDPFTTKSNMANSPPPSGISTGDTSSDPFTTKSNMANSPPPSGISTGDTSSDPFTTKSNMANSPPPSGISTEDALLDTLTMEPKVCNSPTPSNTLTADPVKNPFSTKSKVANSPPPSGMSTDDSLSDPFTTKSKVANSPTSAVTTKIDPLADLDPFTTKSKVPKSPLPQAPAEIQGSDSSVEKPKAPEFTSQTTQKVNQPASSEKKIDEDKSASSVPDFSEEEFRPATDNLVFYDSSFLDVLEKFGSDTSESKMSDLARMSLYVKFDPLVDLPASDPRRESMNLLRRGSIMNRKSIHLRSLSEVPNSEETMLLIGTPPKQLALQRLTNLANRAYHIGSSPGSTSTTPKGLKTQFDLLCANTPPPSVKKSARPARLKSNSNLPEDPADNLAAGTDDNIVEVLQYTDKDMHEMKSSLFLEFQGQKLLLEREFEGQKLSLEHQLSKVVESLKAEIAERDKALEETYKTLKKRESDIQLLSSFSDEFEKIIEELHEKRKVDLAEKEKELAKKQEERDQAVQDTQSLEKAFYDLYRRHEKAKEALDGYVKNQETLVEHTNKLQASLVAAKMENNEKMAELAQQLEKKQEELEEKDSELKQLETSSAARAKKDKLQIESLQKTLDQKISESKELTQMYEDLLAKVTK